MTETTVELAPPSFEPTSTGSPLEERLFASGAAVLRTVIPRQGAAVTTELAPAPSPLVAGPVAASVGDRLFLRLASPPARAEGPEVGIVDLFSGLGGLSLGLAESARALGLAARCVGVDSDAAAIAMYQRNLDGGRGLRADVSAVFDGRPRERATASEQAFMDLAGPTSVLVGGPPCQGHSAFNNRTRHADGRNTLYLTMVRAAEVLEPEHVVIENVPGALRDRSSVVQRSMEMLTALGYSVSHGVVDMARIGVPQLRRRLIVLASRARLPGLETALAPFQAPPRTVRWAIEDLVDRPPDELFDTPARSAPQTRSRIDSLFDGELWNLPNEYRPACHAHGDHSYGSIYGRLRWDEPAQTITTGFYSMCMGRYVHPSRRRTITAHEAARLQFLPDYLDFGGVTQRGDLARLVGNAVPLKLGYVLGLELLG